MKKNKIIKIKILSILACALLCVTCFCAFSLNTVPSNATAETITEDVVLNTGDSFTSSYATYAGNEIIPVNNDYLVHTPNFIEVDGNLYFKDVNKMNTDTNTYSYLSTGRNPNDWAKSEWVGIGAVEEQYQHVALGFAYVTNPDFFYESNTLTDFETLKEKYGFNYKLFYSAILPGMSNHFRAEEFGADAFALPDYASWTWELPQASTDIYYFFRFTYAYQYAKIKKSIPLGGGTYTSTEERLSILDRSPYAPMRPKGACIEYLENYGMPADNSSLFTAIQKYAGIYNEADATIKVNYIKMNDFNLYENKTESYLIPSEFLQNKAYIEKYAGLNLTEESILKWNATYKDYYIDGTGEYLLSERILRQAIDFEYSYDIETNSGTVNIIYTDFFAKDLSLRITNNDPTNLLTVNVYTTNVKTVNGNIVLTWLYSTIEEQLYNSCSWLFDLTPGQFEVQGKQDAVSVSFENNEVTVSVPLEYQADLFGLSITSTAVIVEDLDYAVTYKYIVLNEDFSETETISEPFILKYSTVVQLGNVNFYNAYGAIIDSAVSPAVLGGEQYYKYAGIKRINNDDAQSCVIEVLYEYNSLLKLVNSFGAVSYKALDDNLMTYKAGDFNFNVPDGWRICNLESNNSAVKVAYNDRNPATSVITLQEVTGKKVIYEITATLTDLWKVSINYLEQYKNSAFFEDVNVTKEVKVSDYENIYEITESELLEILEKDTFDLLGLTHVKMSAVKVDFNDIDTYSINLTKNYTNASMRKINSDGSYDEVLIAVTSFETWCDFFGKDWSILWLNSPGNKVFTYEDDVAKDKLYGLFSVVNFEEQVTNLNSILSEYRANGCTTVYQSRKVVGSDFYKWANRNLGNVGSSPLALLSVWGCEVFDSDNHEVYSYFFYLDGTSDEIYTANNGAESIDDTDSATKNFFEKVGSFLWSENNVVSIIIKIVLGLIALALVIGVVFFFIWFFKKLIAWIKRD